MSYSPSGKGILGGGALASGPHAIVSPDLRAGPRIRKTHGERSKTEGVAKGSKARDCVPPRGMRGNTKALSREEKNERDRSSRALQRTNVRLVRKTQKRKRNGSIGVIRFK